jgi:hypothetical protein
MLGALQAVHGLLEVRRQGLHAADHVFLLQDVERRKAGAQATGWAE